jgi:hypothetical protein
MSSSTGGDETARNPPSRSNETVKGAVELAGAADAISVALQDHVYIAAQ